MKHLFILFVILCGFSACKKKEDSPTATSTVTLNMIVKNESQVIERCLSSVLPLIDYWVIVDTGSTDGTQQIIKNFMKKKGIPGELHERPWINFEHNRNEALHLAKGKADYVFFIDADEYLVFDPKFQRPTFDKDFYHMNISYGGSRYCRTQLVNNKLNWKWIGMLHEYISAPEARTWGTFENVYNFVTTEGDRSKDPKKYLKDAQILEAALEKEPKNDRYVFYLAQSYKDAGEYEKALQNYEKRITMGGWNQEVFWSLYQVAWLKQKLKRPEGEIIASYTKAYQYRPSRLEPLYELAHYYREKGNFEAGYRVSKIALSLPPSNDLLFIQQWMHDYGLLLEFSICAYWTNRFDECQQTSLELLKRDLPPNVRTCIENNLGFANAKLLEQITPLSLSPAFN